MTFKSMVACAVVALSCWGAAHAAEQIDFRQISKEVQSGGSLDSAVPAPSGSILARRRSDVLARLHPSQHGAFDSNAPADSSDKLDYYNRVHQRLSR